MDDMIDRPFFVEARKSLHAALLEKRLLSANDKGVPSIADGSNKTSVSLANGMMRRLGTATVDDRLVAQMSGSEFEDIVCSYLRSTFLRLDMLRPGDWEIERGGRNLGIAQYDQYEHLRRLREAAAKDPQLAMALGNDYLIKPDIVILRRPVPDDVINAGDELIDRTIARNTSIREVNNNLPILHASVSCKWTIRSDRVQNARSEGLVLVRNRKGRLPHVSVVTAEPLPSRISAIALGTGDIDCVYHIALPELIAAAEQDHPEEPLALLQNMVEGKRLRDISDLPFDLAV